MFGKKRNKENKQQGRDWTDKAAGKLASAGIKMQTKFAMTMNKQVSRIPQQKLKNILILFCLLSGGFSIYLVVYAVFGKEKDQPAFNVKQMDIPKHYNRSGSEIDETGNYVGEDLYREIQDYKRYMDSLGQPIRPGLVDSIRILEQIYNSQKK